MATAPLSANWQFRVMGALAERNAPRLFSTAEFQSFVEVLRPGTSKSAINSLIAALVQGRFLYRVSSGLYLNGRTIPSTALSEAAARIRAGAVVSLHSVLGECGFLNNPSRVVVSVLPSSSTLRPNVGQVRTSGGAEFWFYGLAERFFPSNDQERWDMYQPGRYCDMFRPEPALLQWLYLARMKRSTLTSPPTNVDMSTLDVEHLHKLAKRWGLEEELKEWHDRGEAVGFDEAKHNYAAQTQKPISAKEMEARLADSTAAKARVMGRHQSPPGEE